MERLFFSMATCLKCTMEYIPSANMSFYPFPSDSQNFSFHQTKARSTLLQMVAADWIRSDKREDDLGSHPGGIVQV